MTTGPLDSTKLTFEVEGLINQVKCAVSGVELVSSCSGSQLTTVTSLGEQIAGSGVFKFQIEDSKAVQTISFDTKITFDGGSTCLFVSLTQKVNAAPPCYYGSINGAFKG
jgi:hypothetical protein